MPRLFHIYVFVGIFIVLIYLVRFDIVFRTVPNFAVSKPKTRIAFYTIGLGKGYFRLALDLLESASQHFCANDFVHTDYYVFSNQPVPDNFSSNYFLIPVVKRGWPFDSHDRFKWVHQHASKNTDYDYILWMDADQKFERPICYDLLGELVGVAHPHYYDGIASEFPYESNRLSKAFVPFDNARLQPYFSAHFFGGIRRKMMHALETMYAWLEEDLANDIHARVDDESYLNAYFYHNLPTAILSRIFVWPEGYENRYEGPLSRHGGREEAAAIARYIADKPRNDEK